MKATVTKVDKRVIVKENKVDGIFTYDVDNNYPERVMDIVDASGMGNACITLYGKYIFGRGFQDSSFAKQILNRQALTADKLLEKIKEDFKYFGGFAIHVNYNAMCQITELNFQPIGHVRFTLTDHKEHPNMFAVSTEWGTGKKINKDKLIYIDKFNPNPETILRQVKAVGGWQNYKGQIYYYTNRPGNYPKPIYDAVLEEMQTDHQSKTYKFRNVTTNFMASHMLVIDPIESGEGVGPEARQKNTIVSDLEEYQGADNAQKIVVVEKDSTEQTFDLKKIDQQNGDGVFNYTETSSRNNIRQAFLIPPVLLMQLDGKLSGTADEMNDAINQYNSTTEDERLAIEEAFRVLCNLFVRKLSVTDNYSIAVRSTISKDDAQRKIDITNVVKDAILSASQKIEILTKQYFLDKVDAEILINAKDIDVANPLWRLTDMQLKEMATMMVSDNLTPAQKSGMLIQVFGMPIDQVNLIFPVNEPNPTNKP